MECGYRFSTVEVHAADFEKLNGRCAPKAKEE